MFNQLRWFTRAVPRLRPATVFMFHSIGTAPVGCDVHAPAVFEAFLDWLTRSARVVSLADFCTATPTRPPDLPLAALTFDDGYLDNYTVAWPLLQKFRCPATFYVVTGWVGRPTVLTRAMIRELSAHGIRIGSHTVTHPHLSTLSPDQAAHELRDSKLILEDWTGTECSDFSYPYGDYNRAVREQVRATGYRSATSVSFKTSRADRFEVPRVVAPTTVRRWQFATSLFAPALWSFSRRWLDRPLVTDRASSEAASPRVLTRDDNLPRSSQFND